MEPDQKFATVGAFIALSLLFLVGFATWLGGWLTSSRQLCYVMRFNNSVAGLTQGGVIKFRGVDVGKISKISFNPQRDTEILVKAMLDAETPVHPNTTATLKAQGVTGGSYIELDIAPSNTVPPPVQSMDGCRVIPTLPSNIQEIFNALPNIAKQAQQALDRVNQVLSDQNLANFDATLANLRVLSAQLNSQTAVIGPQLSAGAQSFNRAMVQVNELSSQLRQSTPGTVQQLNQALAQAQEALAEINGLARDIHKNPLGALQPPKVKEEKVP